MVKDCLHFKLSFVLFIFFEADSDQFPAGRDLNAGWTFSEEEKVCLTLVDPESGRRRFPYQVADNCV